MGQSEAKCQTSIANKLYEEGGWWVNGNYTKSGEADLQCGKHWRGRLYYLAVEVKDEDGYNRLMSGLNEVNSLYEIVNPKKLHKHEFLQVHKINEVRKRGGLAIIAYNYKQVEEYCNGVLSKM